MSEAFLMECLLTPLLETTINSINNSLAFCGSFNLFLKNPTKYLKKINLENFINFLIWSFLLIISFKLIDYLIKLFFVPLNRTRHLGDVGYKKEMIGASGKAAIVDAVMKRRKTGDIPPVFPNGWFAILESRDLELGNVKSVSCLGKNLAVFRGENGLSHIIDAYCPHMGANMAEGGIVKGNCLECPFHGWLFKGDGKCVHVPYCEEKHIPNSAKVKSYVSLEMNGFILMWHHAEEAEPLWFPPHIEEIRDNVWKYGGRTEHMINAHIEEIPENGADVAHLKQVHGPIMTTGVDLSLTQNFWWSFTRHDWVGMWTQNEEKPHIGQMDLQHKLVIFGKFCPILDLHVKAYQLGPGLVHLLFESPLIGKGAYIQTLTPLEPLVQRVVHHIYISKYCPTIIAKFFLFAEALMVERDIMIWNNKQYVARPLLLKSKEDALIHKHRKWYSQFYSDNSPRLNVDLMIVNDW